MNITDRFISGIQSCFAQSLPRHVVEKGRISLLDYLACAIGGAKGLRDSAMQNFIKDANGLGNSHVVGCAGNYSMTTAALLNGFFSHYLELDDGYRKGAIHIGSPVISALMVVAEKENIRGDDFMRGLIGGYEATARLSSAVQPGCRERGYHATGVCGTIGAAIGVAIALRFTKEQMKSTISAAITSAAGVLEMQEDASELKPYNAGRAAMDAVMAVYFAKAGFLGPNDPIGGRRGFLSIMTDTPKYDFLTVFNSGVFLIEQSYLKLYAACRHAHPAIEAVLTLRDRVAIEDINSIRVLTYKQALEGHSHKELPSVSSAKMSIPFGVAVALVTGNAGMEAYSEGTIRNEEVLDLMQLVSVEENDDLTALNPQKRAAIVEIDTLRGSFIQRVDYPKGEPESPLTRNDVEHKFRHLALFAGFREDECRIVIDEIWSDNIVVDRLLSVLSH